MAFPSTSRRAGLATGLLVLGYLLIDLAAGAPGSPLVPPLPAGVRAPGWSSTGARWIGLDRLSRTGLALFCILLLAAIVASFFLLLWEARRRRVRPAIVLAAAAVSLAVSAAAPVVLSRDVHSYAAYGRIFSIHHGNPYVDKPSEFPGDPFVRVASPAWIDTRAVYGPGFVLVAASVSRLWSGSPGATILAFKVLAGLGTALATVLAASAAVALRRRAATVVPAPGRSGRNSSPPGRAPPDGRLPGVAFAVIAVGLNPVIVVHTVGGAHSDALIAACLAGALALAVRLPDGYAAPTAGRDADEPARRYPADGGAAPRVAQFGITGLLTFAGLIKVVLSPILLVWLWWLLRWTPPHRRVGRAAVHLAVALGLVLALAAPFLNSLRALGPLVTLASVEGWASPARLVARGARALGDSLGGASLADVFDKIVVAAFLAAFAVAFVRVFHRRPGGVARSDQLPDTLGAFMLGLALAIPYFLPWYSAWFIPFLPLMADARLSGIGFGAVALLALTGIPAEPGTTPGLWRDMVLAVHYVAAPAMLALFLAWLARMAGRPSSAGGGEDAIPRMADRAGS